MEFIKIDNLSNGLYLSGPATKLPAGFMRRYKGISAFSKNSVISRDGSTLIHSLAGTPHSCIYYNSKWYIAISTVFYEQTTSIKTGLSGDRLSFSLMAPVAGVLDHLFVAGGGSLFKVDSGGNVTNWGIAAPATSATLADGGAGGNLDDGAIYSYAFTFRNSATGTRSNALNLGNNPQINANFKVLLHGEGTPGSTTITNSIGGGPSFTASGGAQIDDTHAKFGACSLDMSTVGGSEYIYAADSADLYLSADFTIAFWLGFWGTGLDRGIFEQYDDIDNRVTCQLAWNGSPDYYYQLSFAVVNGGTTICTMGANIGNLLSYNDFIYIAITRSGNDWKLFKNGIIVATDTDAGAYPDLSGNFEIGRKQAGSTVYMTNWIDEFIIVKGEALYTGNFTPPTQPFGLNQIDLAGGSTSVDISAIPQPSDDQVDEIEIWRTAGGGTTYFKNTAVADGTTTYTDDLSDDDLLSEELPTDNIVPYAWFDDCFGPWNASMFWITRTEEGKRGRVYYSPIGRAEAVQSYIEVTSDSDGLQRIISYGGNLFAISRAGIFQIYGNNPYYSRQLPGLPGTNLPHTVKITPFGVMYESQDGVRVFNGGAQAKLIAYEQVAPIFRGRTLEGIGAFSGTVAEFARGEYIIANGSYAFALDVEEMRWRNLSAAIAAIAYDPSNDVIAAGIGSKLLNFEKEGDETDDSTAIAFEIETGQIEFNPPSFIDLVRVDANANEESLTGTCKLDTGDNPNQALTSTNARRFTEILPYRRICNRLSINVAGSVSDSIEVFGFEIYHTPCFLALQIGKEKIKIPGRLAPDFSIITFEDFGVEYHVNQATLFYSRIIYDIDANSNALYATLYYANGSSEGFSIGGGANRITGFSSPLKIGTFNSLKLSGDFTNTISIYDIQLISEPVTLKIFIDKQLTAEINGIFTAGNTITFELFEFNDVFLDSSYIFEHLLYDLYTVSQNIAATLYQLGESSVSLGNINNAARGTGEINIQKKGRFQKLTLVGTMTSFEFYRLELHAKSTRPY